MSGARGAAARFFRKHAGFVWDPSTAESPDQAKRRNAAELADAEAWATEQGYTFGWADDDDDSADGDTRPDVREMVAIFDQAGDLIDSLGSIRDADANYRRCMEATLALTVMRQARPTVHATHHR